MKDGFIKKVLINSLIVVASFVALALISRFLDAKIEAKGEKILSMRTELAQYAGSGERLASLKNLSVEALEYEKKMELFLPTEDQLWNFPEFLRGVAKDHQVELTISFLPNSTFPSTETEAGYVGFSMKGKGGFSSLVDFLDETEKKTTRFWVGLDNVEINAEGDSFSLQSQGKVFFKK